MNCKDLEELLSAYADGELSRTQREFIEEHLSGCADCRETLAEFEAAGRQLSSLRETPVASDIRTATLSKIKATRALPEKSFRRWLRPVTAAAAIVAVIAVLLVAQPWGMESPEVMAASIVRNSPEVQAALNGEEIEEVEVTTKVVDDEGNVLMMLVRTEERVVAAEVNLETKKVTEIVHVNVPDFQPGDEQKAIAIAKTDPKVQELLAQGGVIGEVHLGYSIDIERVTGPDGVTPKEGTVTPTALLTIELDGKDWNIVVNPHEGRVLSIGQSQPSDAMILVHIHRFLSTVAAPILLVLGILLILGLAYNNRAARAAAGVASLVLGVISLFIELYGMSSIWWRLVTIVGIPVVGLVIGITDIRRRVTKRYIPITGIILCALALVFDLFHAIIVPGGNIGIIIGVALIIAGIIAYAFKEQIMTIRVSGKWLRPAIVALAAVAVLIVALVQPWQNPFSPQNVLAKAHEATAILQSYRISFHSDIPYLGEDLELTFEGEFVTPDRYRVKMVEDGEVSEGILLGDRLFVSGGDMWRNTYLALIISSSTFLTKEMTLKMLDSLVDLEELPDEKVDDSACFHYRGWVDLAKQIEDTDGLDPSDPGYEDMMEQVERARDINYIIELWIGKEDYLIRQAMQTYRVPAEEEGQWNEYNLTMRNYDFNQPITIEPPLTNSGELQPGWEEIINSTFSRPDFSSGHAISINDDDENPELKRIKFRFFVGYSGQGEAKNVRVTVTTMLTNEENKPVTVELQPSRPGPIDLEQREHETFTTSWEYNSENTTEEEELEMLASSQVMIKYTTPYGVEKIEQLYPEEPPYPTKTPPSN